MKTLLTWWVSTALAAAQGFGWSSIAAKGNATAVAAAGGPSSLLTGLQAYWTLDESSDGSAPVVRYDSTANDNDLTDNNNCPSASGALNNAVDCSTANDYLSIADNDFLGMTDTDGEFTLTQWIWLDSTNSSRYGAGKSDDSDWEYYIFYSASGLNWRGRNKRSTGQTVEVTASNFGAAQTNTWYFICLWRDTSDNYLRITVQTSGSTAGTTNQATSASINTSDAPFVIGKILLGASTFGHIDEVGFWKRVLSREEREALFGSGTPAEYPFTGLP